MAIQQAKPRYRVKVIHNVSGRVLSDQVSSYVYAHVPAPTAIGVRTEYAVVVEYLGDHQFKQPYAKRLAAQQRNEKAAKKAEAERQAKALVLRRKRIMNQIELAFAKNGRDAVKFVTCDKCEAPAKVLGLTHEIPGATVIDPDQITGAVCEEHNHKWQWPFKTTAVIECALLEFFYDGIRQIYINRPANGVIVE